jgi:hypothetical protein
MSKHETTKSQIPAEIEELWGEPALLSFEDPQIYRKLLLKFVADFKPADVVGWMRVKYIADQSWEIRRLRRLKAQLIERRIDDLRRQAVAEYVRDGKKVPPKISFTEFTTAGLVAEELRNYESFEALLVSAEVRLLALLREIERRRHGLASRLSEASDDIVDGEFNEIGPGRESARDTEAAQPAKSADHALAAAEAVEAPTKPDRAEAGAVDEDHRRGPNKEDNSTPDAA